MVAFYKISLEAYGCIYTLRINDAKVYEDRDGKGTTVKIPVNQFLANGKNKFKVSISPEKNQNSLYENTVLRVSLLKVENDNVTEILFKEQAPAFNPAKPQVYYSIEKEYDFKELLVTTALESAIPIRNSFDLRNNLIKEYKKIWNLFKQKDIKLLMDEYALKSKEYCLVYGLDIKEHQQSGYDSLSQVLEPGWVLWDIDYPTLIMEISFFDKMVVFYNKWGKSPLLLYNEDINITTYFDLFFCQFASGADLQIIR